MVLLAVLGLGLGASPALAKGFEVEPMINGKSFLGCMATDAANGLVFIALESSFSVMLSTAEFKVVKGDKVAGTWAVDDAKPKALATTADGAGVVSIDVDPTKENIALFSEGEQLTAKIGKSTHVFSLENSEQGLRDLSGCMKTNAPK